MATRRGGDTLDEPPLNFPPDMQQPSDKDARQKNACGSANSYGVPFEKRHAADGGAAAPPPKRKRVDGTPKGTQPLLTDIVAAGSMVLRCAGWQHICKQHELWQVALSRALIGAGELSQRVAAPLLSLGVFDTLIVTYHLTAEHVRLLDPPVACLIDRYQQRAEQCVWSHPSLKLALLVDVMQNKTLHMVREALKQTYSHEPPPPAAAHHRWGEAAHGYDAPTSYEYNVMGASAAGVLASAAGLPTPDRVAPQQQPMQPLPASVQPPAAAVPPPAWLQLQPDAVQPQPSSVPPSESLPPGPPDATHATHALRDAPDAVPPVPPPRSTSKPPQRSLQRFDSADHFMAESADSNTQRAAQVARARREAEQQQAAIEAVMSEHAELKELCSGGAHTGALLGGSLPAGHAAPRPQPSHGWWHEQPPPNRPFVQRSSVLASAPGPVVAPGPAPVLAPPSGARASLHPPSPVLGPPAPPLAPVPDLALWPAALTPQVEASLARHPPPPEAPVAGPPPSLPVETCMAAGAPSALPSASHGRDGQPPRHAPKVAGTSSAPSTPPPLRSSEPSSHAKAAVADGVLTTPSAVEVMMAFAAQVPAPPKEAVSQRCLESGQSVGVPSVSPSV